MSGRATLGYLAGTGVTNATTKVYYEVTVNVVGTSAQGTEAGFANGSQSLSNFIGSGGNSVCVDASTGDIFYNGASFATYTALIASVGTVYGIYLDEQNQKIWWTVDGTTFYGGPSGTQDPGSNQGGFTSAAVMFNNGGYFTVFAAFGSRQTGPSATANFAGPFTHTVASGFLPYDPGLLASLTDSTASSDTLSGLVLTPMADTATSSDVLSSVGTFHATLTESTASSDALTIVSALTASLADSTATSDTLSVAASAVTMTFSALARIVLYSHGGNAGITFDGIYRSVLGSAGSSAGSRVRISGLIRQVLGASPPPTLPIAIFPDLPQGFPIKLAPNFDTTIGTVKSLRELRVAQRLAPLWDFEIPFEELRDQTQNQTPYTPNLGFTQYEQLVETWLMMYGQSSIFAFFVPWDNSRQDQQIGVGDGRTFVFTIYRTWGLGAQETLASIGALKQLISLKVNGIDVDPSLYYIDRNKVFFVSPNGQPNPPGAGLPITMTFIFYYLCKFVEDEQDFEEFAKNRWTVPSLKFQSVNWP